MSKRPARKRGREAQEAKRRGRRAGYANRDDLSDSGSSGSGASTVSAESDTSQASGAPRSLKKSVSFADLHQRSGSADVVLSSMATVKRARRRPPKRAYDFKGLSASAIVAKKLQAKTAAGKKGSLTKLRRKIEDDIRKLRLDTLKGAAPQPNRLKLLEAVLAKTVATRALLDKATAKGKSQHSEPSKATASTSDDEKQPLGDVESNPNTPAPATGGGGADFPVETIFPRGPPITAHHAKSGEDSADGAAGGPKPGKKSEMAPNDDTDTSASAGRRVGHTGGPGTAERIRALKAAVRDYRVIESRCLVTDSADDWAQLEAMGKSITGLRTGQPQRKRRRHTAVRTTPCRQVSGLALVTRVHVSAPKCWGRD